MAKSHKKSSKKHRVTVHAAGKKTYKVSGRSPFSSKKGVTISNPSKRHKSKKRGFLRSNPGPVTKAFSVDSLLNVLSVAAGAGAAMLVVPKIAGFIPTSMVATETAKKYEGLGAIAIGLGAGHFVGNDKIKKAALGVAGVGLLDLVVKNFGSSIGLNTPLLSGDDWFIPGMYLHGQVAHPSVEVGAPIDRAMSTLGGGGVEVGAGLSDWSLAGLDLTI